MRYEIAQKISIAACECVTANVDSLKYYTLSEKLKNFCLPQLLKNLDFEMNDMVQEDSKVPVNDQRFINSSNVSLELQNSLILNCEPYSDFISSSFVIGIPLVLETEEELRAIIAQWNEHNKEFKGEMEYYYDMALAYFVLGNYRLALKEINNSIQGVEDLERSYILKAHIYFEIEEYKKAHEYYLKGYELRKKVETLMLVKLTERKMILNAIKYTPTKEFVMH
jgi:tetratricopeptide (TPR) repeat protein